MAEVAAIARKIDLLERIQVDFTAIASRDDDRRRHDLVELRRKLSAIIGEVAQEGERFFAQLSDPALLREYRSHLSRMRTTGALHQANWPAVLLDQRSEDYRTSAAAVREATRLFVTWVRETLAQVSSKDAR